MVQYVTLLTGKKSSQRFEMASAGRYLPSEREQAFLKTIENPKYDRQIINGLKPFFQD
jgi:hypothetical protein